VRREQRGGHKDVVRIRLHKEDAMADRTEIEYGQAPLVWPSWGGHYS